MTRFRICDVETLAHERASDWLEPMGPDPDLLEPIEPDSRLKDPVKVAANLADVERRRLARPAEIEASIKARTAERDEKLALDIDCNRIVCLGYKDVDGGDPVVTVCKTEAQEAAALGDLWRTYSQYHTRFVTFHGLGFDLPVLMRRSLYLGVKFPALNVDRYRSNHIDICRVLSFNGAVKPRSLKFYCKRFGIETGDPFDGSQVAQLVAECRWDDVIQHCTADIGATHMLAERLGLLEAA